ncbi:MAG: CotH kinase family protein [Chitinophagaceae bacterium]|nr:CotH kinase family protein [Chitinophagaceae bacterium]
MVFSIGLLFSINPLFAQLTTTNLPIIKITTTTPIISSQTQANIAIIDNISGVNNVNDPATFSGMIGVDIRGSISTPKLSYNVETWQPATVSLDTSLLGMPSENDWVLLAAYTDRSLLRSTLAFTTYDKMGRYAPRMKYCELLIDGNYQGVYLFGENIKRNVERVDISKLTISDNFGIDMTGGYIWTLDEDVKNGWKSGYNPLNGTANQEINFNYNYPSSGDITPAQKAYIKSYVDSFEIALDGANFQDSLLGWRRFGANNAFIDMIIISETFKDYDAYRNNFYMFKDKGTKMRPGPIWGFNNSLKNTTNCTTDLTTGFTYNIATACPNEVALPTFWWSKLMTDAQFVKDLKCAYTNYRKVGELLDTTTIFHYMDSVSTLLNAQNAQTRNFTQWPIFGVNLINEPTPMATNYAEEIANIKSFFRARLTWLDGNWIDPTCIISAIKNNDLNNYVSVYPNPAQQKFAIDMQLNSTSAKQIEILDMLGNVIFNNTTNKNKINIDCAKWQQGIYFVKISSKEGSATKKIVIAN